MARFFLGLRVFGLVLAGVVLGAHFFRKAPATSFDVKLLVAGFAAFMLIFALIPNRFTVKLYQGWMLLGVREWVMTAMAGVAERQAEGKPWLRMAIILYSVAALTLLAAAAPSFGRLARYYGRKPRPPETPPVT